MGGAEGELVKVRLPDHHSACRGQAIQYRRVPVGNPVFENRRTGGRPHVRARDVVLEGDRDSVKRSQVDSHAQKLIECVGVLTGPNCSHRDEAVAELA
jgi:hypothetical protein